MKQKNKTIENLYINGTLIMQSVEVDIGLEDDYKEWKKTVVKKELITEAQITKKNQRVYIVEFMHNNIKRKKTFIDYEPDEDNWETYDIEPFKNLFKNTNKSVLSTKIRVIDFYNNEQENKAYTTSIEIL